MKISPWILALSLGLVVAEPAMAQSRPKDDSRRTEARQPASEDRSGRRRDPVRATSGRVPERPAPPRPRDDDRTDRRRHRGIIAPITVLSPRLDYDRRSHYDVRYPYGHRARVWRRVGGMTCLQLADELAWAHDEWHWRNDRHRGRSWYDVEHARLELRIAEERAWSGCGRQREHDCEALGRYPRTGDALDIGILVLDILLGPGHERRRW